MAEPTGGTGNIKVTPEQLGAIATQLTNGAANVDSILSQLAGAVSPLGTDWAGAAQGRFNALWAQWQHDAKGLHDALSGISTLMTRAAATYDETEQMIAASFNR
jgi:WXG100 family type VII secretion target